MGIKAVTYQCQKCKFTFERRGEPESCPQCGHGFLLPIDRVEAAKPEPGRDETTNKE